MYLSLNCLKEFVKIPKKTEAQEIARLLTMHTVEVESWRLQNQDFDKVVVGKVLSVSPHPNADRLRLAKVDIKKEVVEVVCGAANLEKGQKVALAMLGAKLPNGLEIKESEIRGQKSSGMICAEDELGLGDDHEGIMVLEDSAKTGQNFAQYLGLDDTIFEIDNKSLSNRGDLWGHYGMARELSVLFKTPLQPYLNNVDKLLEISGQEKIDVKIEDRDICSRYIAVKINKVKHTESPRWLKDRLLALGVKPINALVDIGNYVMFELGQPLHVFDAKGIQKIVVRKSKNDEGLETLDGKERLLPDNTIVISNAKEIIAIAGVMGGLKSAVNETTDSIILEAANFDPVLVRQTSQYLNLRTDASIRFEKTLDPNLTILAWQRAWQLIKEIMPEAELAGEANDVTANIVKDVNIELDFSWLKKRLGHEFSRKEVLGILERLGFVVNLEKNIFKILVPTWRAIKDVTCKEDVLEEVARVIGYNNLNSSLPSAPLIAPKQEAERALIIKIQDVLSTGANFSEVYNYSFISEQTLSKLNLGPDNYLKLVNPISDNHTMLRQSLLSGLLANVRLNQFNQESFSLFEIGRVFLPVPGIYSKGGEHKDEQLPYQGKRLGMLTTSTNENEAFYNLKGSVQLLFNNIWPQAGLEFIPLENELPWSRKNRAAFIFCAGKEVGVVAEISESVAKSFHLKVKTAIAEINIKELLALVQQLPKNKYQALPKYPSLVRDMAFVVDEKVLYNDFRKELLNFHPLLIAVELFDIYQDESLGAGLKSWAFHLTYQDKNQTLNSVDIDRIQSELINYLQEKFEAQVRSF
jgi:phenylalanyl-tRNA synthetase beta chain